MNCSAAFTESYLTIDTEVEVGKEMALNEVYSNSGHTGIVFDNGT